MLFTQFLIILTIAEELCYFGQVQARFAHNMCYVINAVIYFWEFFCHKSNYQKQFFLKLKIFDMFLRKIPLFTNQKFISTYCKYN